MINDLTAENKQCQDREERQTGCQNGSAQRLVDAGVHNDLEIVSAANLQDAISQRQELNASHQHRRVV